MHAHVHTLHVWAHAHFLETKISTKPGMCPQLTFGWVVGVFLI